MVHSKKLCKEYVLVLQHTTRFESDPPISFFFSLSLDPIERYRHGIESAFRPFTKNTLR